jgi:hypothetical protein
MKRTIVVLLLLALTAACATGPIQTSPLPKIADPENAVEITVIRESHFVGSAISYFITLDDKEVFGIRSGEYTRFKVSPGKHSLAARCFGGFTPTWKESKIEITLQPKEKAYYLFSKAVECAKVESLQPQDVEALIAKSKYRQFE